MKVLNFLTLFLFLSTSEILVTKAQGDDECQATTKFGGVFGFVQDIFSPTKTVCSYLGIPFASPPVGPLRFKAPQSPQPWSTPLNATVHPNWCPQTPTPPEGSGIIMSEDFLYLNVYQPRSNGSTGILPVMMYIHGGGFILGSAFDHTHSRLLARGDVILVVVQYRLGLLGFLSTGDEVASGNWGLKDMSFAIRWVSENIEAFGGDAQQISIFGQSAGSAAVTYQLISPLNRGLFRGAIAQSGSALN